jgi:DNA polymerase-3 subunit delta'
MPWQQDAWARLQRSLQSNTMPHALLLRGSAGIGKTCFSESLAALLLCHQPSPEGACGNCRSCQLLNAGSHSDLLYLRPEKSRLIKIDQVRSLIDFSNQTPALGQRKIILINPAEVMNSNAANALLKCLEEPSSGTFLLLVSHASGTLPATIRSRCQQLPMPEPSAATSAPWLDQYTGDSAISAELLAATGNRPMAALELHLNDGLEKNRTLQQALDALSAGTLSALDFPQLVADQELDEVLDLLAVRIQAEIRRRAGLKTSNLRPHFQLLEELQRLQRAVVHGGNPNRQLTIESCATEVARLLGGRG